MRTRCVALVAMGLIAGACSAPIKVSRVPDTNVAAKGIRYIVRTPRFVPYLRYKETDDAGAALSRGKKLGFDVILAQKPGKPTVYEASIDGRVFSDTEVTIKQKDGGELSAFTAGEKDRLAEIIATTASIVAAAAPGAAPLQLPTPLKEYVDEHRKLLDRRKALHDHLLSPMTATAVPSNDEMEAIARMHAELERLDTAIEEHRFELSGEQCVIKITTKSIDKSGSVTTETRTVIGEGAKTPWVVIQLEKLEDKKETK